MLRYLFSTGYLTLVAAGLSVPSVLSAEEPKPRTAFGGNSSVASLAFSPDGKTLAAGSGGIVTAWDVAIGKNTVVARAPSGGSSLSYSPDGKYLLWSGGDDTVTVWDVAAGKEKANLKGRPAQFVVFSPDGKTVAWGGKNPSSPVWDVRVWDFAAEKEQVLQEHGRPVFSLSYSPDGKLLTWGCGDNSIKVWDLAKGREVGNYKDRNIQFVVFSPDGKTLASAESDEYPIKILEASTGKDLVKFKGREEDDQVLAFSPDGKTLASGGDMGTVRLWEVATGKQLSIFKAAHPNGVFCLTFSPDGKTLASGGSMGGIKLWDVPVLGTMVEM